MLLIKNLTRILPTTSSIVTRFRNSGSLSSSSIVTRVRNSGSSSSSIVTRFRNSGISSSYTLASRFSTEIQYPATVENGEDRSQYEGLRPTGEGEKQRVVVLRSDLYDVVFVSPRNDKVHCEIASSAASNAASSAEGVMEYPLYRECLPLVTAGDIFKPHLFVLNTLPVIIAAVKREKARKKKNDIEAQALRFRIRLRGIDAPETQMPFGKEAHDELVNLLEGKCIKVVVYTEDFYRRWIADIYCDGELVQDVMLKKGLAWHYVAYDKRAELAKWEGGEGKGNWIVGGFQSGEALGMEKEETRQIRYSLTLELKPWKLHIAYNMLVIASSAEAFGIGIKENRDLLMEQNVALDLARREAETAIRARNDFLAVMNHEMRTPMHAIIALSSLLQETELTPEQRLMVETILKSSNLLATLMNDVLDLSRLEDGSLQLELGTFNLHNFFREVLNLIKPTAVVKKLPITLNLAPDLPEFVVGDEKRLTQIILNIVGNAVKFSKQGSISVTALVTKSDNRAPDFFVVPTGSHFYLRVKVKDSGAGINPQDIPKLFTKFAQTQSLATRSSGGSGLGLAISKRFVNLMEGNIWIESDGLGKGCTAIFDVKLGISERSNESKQSGIPKAPANPRHANFTGLKVLVMDENGVSRMVTKGLLVHLGCEVTTVSSNEECLRVVSHEHKVVFMDVCMPGVENYQIALRIHEKFTKQRHQRPLLVALTGNTDKSTKEKCMSFGLDGVLLKPVSLDNMRDVLSDLLEKEYWLVGEKPV